MSISKYGTKGLDLLVNRRLFQLPNLCHGMRNVYLDDLEFKRIYKLSDRRLVHIPNFRSLTLISGLCAFRRTWIILPGQCNIIYVERCYQVTPGTLFCSVAYQSLVISSLVNTSFDARNMQYKRNLAYTRRKSLYTLTEL
ncbi:hypothetical protein NPIL_138541 [Nephila pilipes]|uniref:Uncharacterized protein n=1 Tax=Nephila pilipes TaxID=299642 RepID=A0A8X6TZG6_NEPPI|nr:hypothetical protein NPIL_138541 [Nephila pilipes]